MCVWCVFDVCLMWYVEKKIVGFGRRKKIVPLGLLLWFWHWYTKSHFPRTRGKIITCTVEDTLFEFVRNFCYRRKKKSWIFLEKNAFRLEKWEKNLFFLLHLNLSHGSVSSYSENFNAIFRSFGNFFCVLCDSKLKKLLKKSNFWRKKIFSQNSTFWPKTMFHGFLRSFAANWQCLVSLQYYSLKD